MHLAFSGNTHTVLPLSKDHEGQGAGQIAIIPCSDYLLYLDPTHQVLCLLLRRGMAEEDLPHVPYTQLPPDLIVSSFFLTTTEGQDLGQCGGLCTDTVGRYIYLLYLSPPTAQIRVLELQGEEFQDTKLVYPLPIDSSDLLIQLEQDSLDELPDFMSHLGTITPVSPHLLGAGITSSQGQLYALTRRTTMLSAAIEYAAPILIALPQQGAVVHQLRLTEVRAHEIQYSVITQLHAETGQYVKTTPISCPSFENLPHSFLRDGVFNGIAAYHDSVLLPQREDTWVVPQDTREWHLQSQLFHWEAPGVNLTGNLVPFVGVLKWDYANTLEGQPPPVLMELAPNGQPWYSQPIAEIQTQFSDIFTTTLVENIQSKLNWAIDLKNSRELRLMHQTSNKKYRGTANVMQFKLPLAIGAGQAKQLSRVYPLDITLPFSIAVDEGDSKFFATIGAAVWVFDILSHTLLVNYGTTLFEGDIVDFGLITAGESPVLQCFIRNDAPFVLYNVQIHVALKSNSPGREDAFLAFAADSEGFKSILLGDIPPGESRQFYARIYVLAAVQEDTQQTIRVPLRVTHNLTDT